MQRQHRVCDPDQLLLTSCLDSDRIVEASDLKIECALVAVRIAFPLGIGCNCAVNERYPFTLTVFVRVERPVTPREIPNQAEILSSAIRSRAQRQQIRRSRDLTWNYVIHLAIKKREP